MSFQSMTGFGRSESSNNSYSLTVEMKSVNHRFRDVRFKGPSLLSSFEGPLKKRLGEVFKRGSFDLYFNLRKASKENSFAHIDKEKVKNFIKDMKEIESDSSLSFSFQATDFLRSEFFQDQDNEKEIEIVKELVFNTFSRALDLLKETRAQEGERMIQVIESHLNSFKSYLVEIEKKVHDFSTPVKNKFREKFEKEFSKDYKIDESRFMQEVIYTLEKLDVSEEIDRLKSHLIKLDEMLKHGGEVGRKLEFFIQELGREVNTIGSKSILEEVSQAVIQMKVQLEKIREQALNLE
ncbi:MAG: YicC family protein [Halobacteriovoraceae bacterium]|nr:YicC family protein [Halobacteriovoraceae bacterium]